MKKITIEAVWRTSETVEVTDDQAEALRLDPNQLMRDDAYSEVLDQITSQNATLVDWDIV